VETGRGEEILGTLGPGECFGEIAVLGKKPRSASVRCVEAMDTVAIPSMDFATLSDHLPELRIGFERIASARRPPSDPAS
jgi:CRP-like cAMP-binding protein